MAAEPSPVRVMLVDDHAVVREGYRNLLEDNDNIAIVGEAESGEIACKVYTDSQPDVVIMDLTLPGMSGLEAIRRILARDANARILIFSMHEDTVFVEQGLQAGAMGYITKSSSAEVLVEAVTQVAAGRIHIDQEIAQNLAVQKSRGKSTPFAGLSTREFEIFCLLAEGANVANIAERLSLSYKTVANYSTQIKNKLNVSTTAELARLAIRHGIVKA